MERAETTDVDDNVDNSYKHTHTYGNPNVSFQTHTTKRWWVELVSQLDCEDAAFRSNNVYGVFQYK